MDISKIPVFDILFDEELEGLVFQSHVAQPATNFNWVALSSQEAPEEMTFKLADEEKMIVAGPLLIPGQKVIRYQGNQPFYLNFSADEIEKYQQHFMQTKKMTEVVDYQHNNSLIPSYVLEMWRVEDPEKDKSNYYGYNLPKGSLFAVHKITDKDYWEQEIKSGKVKGFSVEIQGKIVPSEELQSNKKKMKKKLKMSTQKFARTVEGALLVNQDASETLAVGDQVFVVAEDGTQTPAPDGEHVLETGETIVILDGVISEIRPTEQMSEETPVETKLAITPEEQTAIVNEVMQILDPKFTALEAKIVALVEMLDLNKAELEKANASLEKANKEVQKLSSAIPGGTSIKKTVVETPQAPARKTIYDNLDPNTERLVNQLSK